MRPVMEKRGFELRHIVYIIILIVCLIAIGIAVYMQFFKDEKIGLILGITKEQEDEEIKQLLEESGLIFLEAYEEYTTQAPQPDSGRIVVVAQEHGKNRRN